MVNVSIPKNLPAVMSNTYLLEQARRSFSPPMMISNQVMKSDGSDPPIFVLSLARIWATLTGLICLAASIRNPLKPNSGQIVSTLMI